ncbi:hypothetical protein ACNOYE_07220 [Nannocystaceae bacterium ST9]
MSALALVLLSTLAPPPEAKPAVEPDPSAHHEPPPPSIEFPPPSEPTEPGDETVHEDGRPPGTAPPGETEGVEIPDPYEDEDEDEAPLAPAVWTIDERTLDGMPYAPTAARKSAVRRGNNVLIRPFRKPTYSVGAAARLGVQLAGGREVIQPIAWGLAAQVRIHFARVVKSRFGVELHAGHTRWQQRDDYEVVEGGSTITRISLLSHTDVSLGPSFEIPLGPVFLQIGGSGGFAVSNFARANSADSADDDGLNAFNGLVRGGLSLGVPITNNQGLTLGVAVQQVFSNRTILVNPLGPTDGRRVTPFGTWLESFVGYQVWF